MGVLEGEVKGERAVTRHVLGQTHHNVDDLGEVKSKLGAIESRLGTVEARLDHMAGDMVVMKVDLGHHGRMLDVLAQDVRMVRGAIDTLGQQVNGLSRQVNGLNQQFNDLSQQFKGLGQQFNGLSQQFNDLGQQVNGLSQQVNGLSQQFNDHVRGLPGLIAEAVRAANRERDGK